VVCLSVQLIGGLGVSRQMCCWLSGVILARTQTESMRVVSDPSPDTKYNVVKRVGFVIVGRNRGGTVDLYVIQHCISIYVADANIQKFSMM
jgi:hypothetical protein